MTEFTCEPTRPEAIIFDLSEVYLRGLKGTHMLVSEHLGSPMDGSVFIGDDLTRLFHGEITEAEYWQAIIEQNEWDATVSELEGMVRDNFVPIDGTEDVVRELKGRGYPLGLLSVHAKEWTEYCEQVFHYREFFDVVMYSFEHGVSKPDPKAYELILDAMGVSAERAMFIDDAQVNIDTARSIGMQAILFSSAPHLRIELVGLGIL